MTNVVKQITVKLLDYLNGPNTIIEGDLKLETNYGIRVLI